MGKDLSAVDSHLLPSQINSGHSVIQIKSFSFHNIASNLSLEDFDEEPDIWFGPIIIVGLAMLMTLGGVIVGLVAGF